MKGARSNRTFAIVAGVLALVVAGIFGVVLKRALGPGPADATGSLIRSGEALDAVLNAARQYAGSGESGKAEAILREAVSKYAGDQRAHLAYAELLVALRRPGEAYDQYEKALAIGPRDAETEFTAGTVASMAARPDRAIEHFAAAQAQKPGDARIPLYLAQVQLKLDQVAEAKKNLLIAGRLDPDKAIVWGTLAEVALRENKLDLADQHAAKARALEPSNLTWRLIHARALKRRNKPEAALELVANLSPAERREPGVLPLIAECHAMLRQPEKAAAVFADASDAEPSDGDLAFHAAEWLDRAGNIDGARRYAQRASMLGHEGARRLLERVGPPVDASPAGSGAPAQPKG